MMRGCGAGAGVPLVAIVKPPLGTTRSRTSGTYATKLDGRTNNGLKPLAREAISALVRLVLQTPISAMRPVNDRSGLVVKNWPIKNSPVPLNIDAAGEPFVPSDTPSRNTSCCVDGLNTPAA